MSHKYRKRHTHKVKFSRRSLPGSAPGTLIADPNALQPTVRLVAYGPAGVLEEEIADVRTIVHRLQEWPVAWIRVAGLGDVSLIAKLGEIFNLHRLALEDVVNVHQRPKVEQYKGHCYVVVRLVRDETSFASEQVSIFLGRNFVLTFQERPGDFFDPIIQRIRGGIGRIRTAGTDHLVYALIDAVTDCYFPVLERYGEALESLENAVVFDPGRHVIERIHEMKYGLLTLRRAAWPLREALATLYRDPIPLIDDEERVYLRDCYDHTVQIIDLLENYRDVASSLMEVYLTSISNRTNEIMKVLTIFTAVFIPLTLIAGIYGMNFDTRRSPWNMPELRWAWGYPFALALMAAVAAGLLLYFRRRGWLGSGVWRP
jgi:magnesium transporter